jgi:hypothetical protein
MRFLNELPQHFLGCDPDSRNMAYAVVDQKGTVVEAWTVDHKSDPLDQSNVHRYFPHKTNEPFVAVVEGQKVYKDDKKSNPDSLITLARASGIACSWIASNPACQDIVIALPQEWKGSKKKAAHQHHIWTSIGEHPRIHGKGNHAYCCPDEYRGMKPTKLKHLGDAIGLALWLKDQYLWNFKKKRLRK